MKLATYDFGDGIGPGLVEADMVHDLRSLGPDLVSLFDQCHAIPEAAARGARFELRRDCLLAPIPAPQRLIGIGLNYRSHARETGREPGPVPTIFAKLPGAVTRPDAQVRHPGSGVQLDYEGEVGLVIGRCCYRLQAEEALDHIAGLVIVNDLTNRALARPETLLLAKSYEGFAPMGPWLTTMDEAPGAGDLTIRTWVNGNLRQQGCAADMIHDFGTILALVTSACRLEPGDVIITGSPAGSGAGFSPPRWLEPGDNIRIEVSGLGMIEHRIAP